MKLAIGHHSERIDDETKYIFGREELATNLKNIFINSDNGFVMAIDADWGQGKTSFIHQLMFDLKKNDRLIPIYYDAFANDFTDDTFLSIGATIYKEVQSHFKGGEKGYKNSQQIQHLKKATKKMALELVKLSSDLAVKSLTAGLVDSKEVVSLVQKSVKNATFDTLELDVNKKFEAYTSAKNNVESYVNALEGISLDDEKVIFFIDELDRCRPDFAVQVLEKVKHLFSANNVIFVVSYNKRQLSQIISNVYGVSYSDSIRYLEKFIHIEAVLPLSDTQDKSNSLSILYDTYISEFKINISDRNIDEISLKELFVALCDSDKLNMNSREIERAFSYVSFCLASLSNEVADNLIDYFLPAALVKVKDSELFNNLKEGRFFKNEDWVYDFFFQYYSSVLTEEASNVFRVKEFQQACDVIQMFRFPVESEVLNFPHDSSAADRLLKGENITR